MKNLLAAAFVLSLTLTEAHAADDKNVARDVTQAPLAQPLSPARGFELTTENGETSVTFRHGWTRATGKNFGRPGSVSIYQTRAITASAPLNDDGDGERTSLDALASGAALEFRYSEIKISRSAIDNSEKMLSMCEEIYASDKNTEGKDCDAGLFEGKPEQLNKFLELIWGKHPAMKSWGVNARAGYDTFDYLDTATLAERSVDKSSWSAKAFHAWRRIGQPWIATVSFDHQEGYESVEAANHCPPGGAPTACVEGSLGAPKKIQKDILAAEYRRIFNNFSVSTTLQYDANNDVWAAEVPFYLTRNKDGDFTGGVKLGWRSDTDEFTAGVFVGTAFSLGAPTN
jgi:hypothetical protein